MKKFLLPLLVLVIAAALIGGSIFAIWKIYKNQSIPQPPKKTVVQGETAAERKAKQTVLIDTIKQIFNQNSPDTTFSLGVYDLKHKEYFGYNDTSLLHAASVSKVLTAIILLDKVDNGEIKLSDPLGAYNVEFQLQEMINISNPDSWDLIDAKLGVDQQTTFAKEKLGLAGVDMRNNLMAVKDITNLLVMLAQGKVLSETSRARLFSYMQKTESEDFFSPAFLKENLTFYHKTGKYLGEGHDAAIVELKKNPFVLVAFTDNETDTDLVTRGTTLTKVAKTVLEYFDELK